MSDAMPPPIARLDPEHELARLRSATGHDLSLVGLLEGGQVGAALVSWPDGHESILTRSGDSSANLERTQMIMELGKAHDLPMPAYELIVDLGDTVLLLQQRLPGSPPCTVDDALVTQLLKVLDRLDGVLVEHPEVPVADLYLTESGPGFCLHESLERYDSETRRLLSRIREIGRDPEAAMTGDDLVHLDFHPGNFLVDDGAVSGLIDWDGISRGDRRFALVTLAFDLSWGTATDPAYAGTVESLGTVERRVDQIDPARRRAYWAHMALRQVDWSIRHHGPAEIAHYLRYAETRLD